MATATKNKTRFRPGVLSGDEVTELLNYANDNNFALPAVNVVGTNSINAVMETAAAVQSPVIIQLSNGGASFYAGKSVPNDKQQAAVVGCISAAANEKFFEQRGYPLFSSHMIDLSEEPLEENIETCVAYFKRMNAVGITLEIELGVTGGEEEKYKLEKDNPINFVFHGGSGSSKEDIREAIEYGAVKMNIDTDMQWATWDGVRAYEKKNHDYLQGQIGNPDGDDVPNKKYYDPRKWLREGETAFVKRLTQAFEDLNCIGKNK